MSADDERDRLLYERNWLADRLEAAGAKVTDRGFAFLTDGMYADLAYETPGGRRFNVEVKEL